ncbi:MAG: hypothetical protein AMJ53_11555 [Gammaproteobacteria bacterium SG8_11]|nr:MAG: hypothetical protein AMJ53_11555 [Gammaproteobacteria bacterium SG8_11]
MRKINVLFKFFIVCIAWLLVFVNPAIAATVTIEMAVALSEEEKKTIIENLSLYQYRESPFLDESYVDNLKVKGINELKSMFQTFGYYKPQISVTSTQQNGNFSVKYTVDLGPPVRVDNVDIQIQGNGDSDSEILSWRQSFPLSPGNVLSHRQYEDAKKNLLKLLRDRGYFSAKLQAHEIKVNLDTFQANIVFSFDTGPRYYFGETYYIQEHYDLGYLHRFLPYSKGELFHADLLTEMHKRLSRSQEFLSVEINPEIARADDKLQVPITIRLSPRKRWRFSLGAGYATDLGVQGSAAITRRRFTRRGHQIGADTLVSETKQDAGVNYTIPAKRPWSDFYNTRYGFTHELTDDTERYTNALTFKSVHELKILRSIFSLSFEHEQFRVGEDPKTYSKLLVPSMALHYNPMEGSILERLNFDLYGEIRGASEDLLSEVSFTQFISRGNLKYKLSKHWTAVSRYNVGFTDIADFNKLPVSYRFFAGGDYSVRGYEYNSLSPVDEEGNRVGGRNLLVGSVELQYRFLKYWDIAGFYDIGNAFNIGNTDLSQGAGFGLGWIYSLLSVRVYYARALDITDQPWRFHFLIGADL